jgi:hypothetical protein
VTRDDDDDNNNNKSPFEAFGPFDFLFTLWLLGDERQTGDYDDNGWRIRTLAIIICSHSEFPSRT